ncbi:MAG TPA: hypothetical protein VFE34_09035, partial [Dongiaceae bacterium]|nr:hypothetical protein [Dongiaceae bacterium]
MDEVDEARKWLRLGYETYGPEGVHAIASAMGLRLGQDRSTTQGNVTRWTTTGGSDKVPGNDS